ncbi:MAG: PEGA domain-containing protein [Thermoanaerobaculia bacterium]
MRFHLAGLLAMCVLGACTEQVHFMSQPPGAKVYVNDTYVGDTPTVFSTRDVVLRPYRVELGPYHEEGTLTPHLAPGRVVGAIFTLGIVAAARPLFYYDPSSVNALLGPGTAVGHQPAVAKLYDLKTSEIATGTCDATGYCSVTFPNGRNCAGDSVRENQGATHVETGSRATAGYAGGYGFGAASAGAAVGRDTANSQHGVAMLQCPNELIDCELTVDAYGPTGHGDCTDPKGGKYRLMLLAP